MQNYFRFNIAKNGKHFFATAEESVHHAEEATKIFDVLNEKFPESEGYNITCSYWSAVGYNFDPNKPENFSEVIKKAYSHQ